MDPLARVVRQAARVAWRVQVLHSWRRRRRGGGALVTLGAGCFMPQTAPVQAGVRCKAARSHVHARMHTDLIVLDQRESARTDVTPAAKKRRARRERYLEAGAGSAGSAQCTPARCWRDTEGRDVLEDMHA